MKKVKLLGFMPTTWKAYEGILSEVLLVYFKQRNAIINVSLFN